MGRSFRTLFDQGLKSLEMNYFSRIYSATSAASVPLYFKGFYCTAAEKTNGAFALSFGATFTFIVCSPNFS